MKCFFLFFSILSISYPFYIENTGEEYGVSGEDINILKTFQKGISGKGIKIKFIGECCNPYFSAIKDHFLPNNSYNFVYNSSDVDMCDYNSQVAGATVVSTVVGDTYENETNTFYGIANSSLFSFTVPSERVDNLTQYFSNIVETCSKDEDIILDFYTHSDFNWQNNERIFYKRKIKEVSDFIMDTVKLSRNYKGAVLISPTKPYTSDSQLSKTSIFENYPEAILVSPSDYRGGSSPIPYYSTAILVNAPSAGNPDISYEKYYPYLPVAKENESIITIRNYTYPYYAGIVAGCASLLLEYNPDLSYRDIQYILLLSSQRNDPKHPFWIKNGGGFYYNPIYGFGRVNVDEAIRISEYWSNSILQTCSSYEKEYENCDFDLPYARMGKLQLKFNIKTFNYKAFTENVIFQFNLSTPDISMLRIIITSPQGTKIEILKPDIDFPKGYPHEFHTSEPYQLLARCFLGEDPNGDWIIDFIDSSFIQGTKLNYAKLIVEAMDTIPELPDIMPYETSPSAYPLNSEETNITIEIDNTTQICGVPFDLHVKLNGVDTFVPLYLIDKETHMSVPFLSYQRKNNIYNVTFPCIYNTTETIELSAQLRNYNLFSSIPLNIINEEENGFLLPEPYETIFTDISNVTVLQIKVGEKRKKLPTFGSGSHYIFALYDLDTNTKISQVSAFMHQKQVLASSLPSEKPEKGIIVTVPVDIEEPDPCYTYVIPISFMINNTSESFPQPFAVPLNDYCPLPNGILTTIPSYNRNTFLEWLETKDGIIITCSVSITVILVIIMLIIICRVAFKSKRQSALDDQILL